MTPHLPRSRITKAIVDRVGLDVGFAAAEHRLASVRVAIIIDSVQSHTPAGQAAALTAIATSIRCFASATLVAQQTAPLIKPLPLGPTLGEAAASLGAELASSCPDAATHCITIGTPACPAGPLLFQCWWDRWLAGTLPSFEIRPLGASQNPLAGVFAGALAVRQVFASVLTGKARILVTSNVASLWEPWLDPEAAAPGPDQVSLPPRLWFIGLGHLGQGVLWNLGLLPVCGQLAVLQDDQTAGVENQATGLLTTAADVGSKKTRVAARWLDALGWPTALIERRHYGDIPLLPDDPLIVITALDEPGARVKIANARFDYMLDAGVGHGPIDFESLQIRILKQGTDPTPFWSAPTPSKNMDAMMLQSAYKTHAASFGECGTFNLAEASVAVPFVGAASGALLIAQLMRLASMIATPQIMQMDLASPAMVMAGRFNDAPTQSLGSLQMHAA